MLDPSPPERAPSGGAQSRLRTYMAALLVLGGVVLLISLQRPEPGGDRLAQPREDPAAPPATPRVDVARIPAADDLVAHSSWNREALDYLLPLSQERLGQEPRRVTVSELTALPFAESRGDAFAVEGEVIALTVEEYDAGQVLWTLVLQGEDGARAIVLKHALASDAFQGRPEDALAYTSEILKEGDRVLVRGLYAQRRTGTFGGILLKEPVPVLIAQPPSEAFRKTIEPGTSIDDPSRAWWDEIEDRFLRDTKNLDEPALYQMLQWARAKGHAYFEEGIESGALQPAVWDQQTFLQWSEEVESETADAPRPFTTGARGQLFQTTGLLASLVEEGWNSVPRLGSAWDVHAFDVLGIMSDHYGNTVFKTISAFPLSAYDELEGEIGEHLRIYGYFLKNHTYDTQKQREGGGRAEITMPVFLVVHAEPVELPPSPYRQMIWIIAGVILVLALLFYAVLVRGERKESARMEAYRMRLKKRIREAESRRSSAPGAAEAGASGGALGETDAPPGPPSRPDEGAPPSSDEGPPGADPKA